LTTALSLLAEAPQDKDLVVNEIQARNSLRQWFDEKAESMRIRSCVDWFEKDKKMTKYFFDKYQMQNSNVFLERLHDNAGHPMTKPEDITTHIHEFYTRFYIPQATDLEARADLLEGDFSQLDPTIAEGLMQLILVQELWEVLSSVPSN